MEILKLYGEDRKTYLVGLKSKITKEDMVDYARKEFRVRADQVVISTAAKDKGDDFFVDIEDGNYWCATRAAKK